MHPIQSHPITRHNYCTVQDTARTSHNHREDREDLLAVCVRIHVPEPDPAVQSNETDAHTHIDMITVHNCYIKYCTSTVSLLNSQVSSLVVVYTAVLYDGCSIYIFLAD